MIIVSLVLSAGLNAKIEKAIIDIAAITKFCFVIFIIFFLNIINF